MKTIVGKKILLGTVLLVFSLCVSTQNWDHIRHSELSRIYENRIAKACDMTDLAGNALPRTTSCTARLQDGAN